MYHLRCFSILMTAVCSMSRTVFKVKKLTVIIWWASSLTALSAKNSTLLITHPKL